VPEVIHFHCLIRSSRPGRAKDNRYGEVGVGVGVAVEFIVEKVCWPDFKIVKATFWRR